MNTNSWFRGIGAVVTTILIFVVLLWWLIIVSRYVGTAPVVDSTGKVVSDTFGNAKDILLAVLPLASTAVGYWLGSQGTAQAQDTAKAASADAASAKAEAATAKAQLLAVVDTSSAETLKSAMKLHPRAFGLPSPGDPKQQVERQKVAAAVPAPTAET